MISEVVARILGPEVLAGLGDLDDGAALSCQVCGQVVPAGSREPMAVVVFEQGDTVFAGLAHLGCHAAVGDVVPALAESVARYGAEGMDATAWFGEREVRPRAVLAFEVHAQAHSKLGAGELVDHWVAFHLEHGWSLLGGEVTEAVPPRARGWSLVVGPAVITLAHDRAGVTYTQELDDEVLDWVALARREGRCLAVTGTGLHLAAGVGPADNFASARLGGRLVGASVVVRPGR